jgi:hypothetical protein
MPARRFLPPWSVEELDAGFVVRDHSGQQLAYAKGRLEQVRSLMRAGQRSASLARLLAGARSPILVGQ